MRALAELENVRKRASRDVEQAHKFALERVAHDLIGVKDSLELGSGECRRRRRAARGTEGHAAAAEQGPGESRLTEIVPQGEQFNPELHER
jgi:molecular chaperone GrpE